MTSTSIRPTKATVLILILPIGCAVAVGGCGSSGTSAASSDSPAAAAFLKFSQCMRANGVPNYPDPTAGGGGFKIAVTPGSGLNPQSPAFQAAQETCRKELPGGGPPRVVPESVKVQTIDHAQCMRAHGVLNYPDPSFPPGGGIESFIPSSVQLNSPAFKSAAKACGGP